MKRKAGFFLFLLSVSIIVGFFGYTGFLRHDLTGVSDVQGSGEYLYVLDNDGTNYDFLKLTREGMIESRITEPKLSGVWWRSFTHLTVGSDDSVYVHEYKISMEEDLALAAVYRCNFSGERLELIWTLEDKKAIACQVKEEALYYVRPGGETGSDFVRVDQKGEETLVYETDFPYERMVAAYHDSEEGAFWSDYNGKFYKNGVEIGKAEAGLPRDRVHISFGDGRIVYTDTNLETVNAVDFQTGETTVLFSASDAGLWGMNLEYKDILPFHYGKDYWYAALDYTGNRRIAAVFDYGGQPVHLFSEAEYLSYKRWTACLLSVFFAYSAGMLLRRLTRVYLKRTGGIVSVLAKLFLSLSPVILAGGLMLGVRLLDTFTDYSIDTGYDLLYALADGRLSRIPPEELLSINLSEIPRDKTYEKRLGGTDYSQLPGLLYDGESMKGDPVSVKTYQWVYLMREDALKYVVVDDNYYGVRVDYYRDREQMKLMEKAMADRVVVSTRYNDQEGNWIALYVPILDEAGKSIGIMESGMSVGTLEYLSRKQTKKIVSIMILFIVVLILILTGVTRLSLHPLARLRRAVEAMGKGDYRTRVPIRGKDEIADISGAFNRMSQQIGTQVEYIEACLNGYEKFVPQRLFQILKRADITKLSLGDFREITASVLAADSSDFPEIARNTDADLIYPLINNTLKVMLPEIAANKGIVDHMLEAGVLAYFPDEAEKCLNAALLICERMNLLAKETRVLPVGMGITRGAVRIGIVGQAERAAVKTMSESVTLAGFLSFMAQKYGARVLITATAAGEIPDFEKNYHVRMIGFLKLNQSNRLEPLYDAYDGELPEIFRRKQDTASGFKAGMDAFIRQDFYEARQQFAQVLKIDKKDLAARAYVYRCDTYYQMEDKSQVELYLEDY